MMTMIAMVKGQTVDEDAAEFAGLAVNMLCEAWPQYYLTRMALLLCASYQRERTDVYYR